MQIIYNWNFQIKIGNNTLLLPAPVKVNQGNYILLNQLTGRVAIDTTGNSSYSDLVWNSTTQWTKLAEFSNWRFFLTTINNFSLIVISTVTLLVTLDCNFLSNFGGYLPYI